ncbi:MAG: hypothetical protein AAF682_29940 [Planctomycetota bacterium]
MTWSWLFPSDSDRSAFAWLRRGVRWLWVGAILFALVHLTLRVLSE